MAVVRTSDEDHLVDFLTTLSDEWVLRFHSMWTLFSEKPPPGDGQYLVTFRWKDKSDKRDVVCLEWDYGQQYWYDDYTVYRQRDIYAWAELPPPYDGEPVDGATDIWPSK